MAHDYKAALDAFNTFDGMTFNGNIEAWQKLGQLLDGHRKTIRSALQLAQEAEQLRKERDAAKKQLQRWSDAHEELIGEVELRARIAELETFIEKNGLELP